MRWLITGADGFAAGHLIPDLLARRPDDDIVALVWDRAPRSRWPAEHPRATVIPGDLTDRNRITDIVRDSGPNRILHLAAASSVAGSWKDPETAYRTNIIGQLHLLDAAGEIQPAPTVVIASSGDIYGPGSGDGSPMPEDTPLRPPSPYAVTKAAQDLQAFQYWTAFGLPTVRLRLFHHTGPGRPPHFVASSFARQAAEIESGLREPVLTVGNLDVARDFTDVRDIARAWQAAALYGRPGEAYNVCSGRATPLRRIVDTLMELIDTEIEIRRDPTLLRPGDIPVLVGDRSRFTETTGWEPEISLETTLGDLLNWWRNAIHNPAS